MLTGELLYANMLYNMLVSGKTRAQHLDMSRCWDVAKIVVQHVRWWLTTNEQIIVACPLVMLCNMLYNMFV